MTVSQVGWVKQCDNRNHGLTSSKAPHSGMPHSHTLSFLRSSYSGLVFSAKIYPSDSPCREICGRFWHSWVLAGTSWVALTLAWSGLTCPPSDQKVLTCFWKMHFSLLSVRSAASKRCRTFESTIIVPGLAHNTRTLSVLHTTCRSGGSCWLQTLVEGVPFPILSWDVKDSVCLYFLFYFKTTPVKVLG